MIHRINLIGCSKSKTYRYDRKRGGHVKPIELYTGQLFKKRVAYSEQRGIPWFVLSAKFGLWESESQRRPSGTLDADEPYNLSMADLGKPDRAVWHASVAYHVAHQLWEPWDNGQAEGPINPADLHIEIHAGRDYAEPLRGILQLLGFTVAWPCEGLDRGKQLQWYNQQLNHSTSTQNSGEPRK